MLSFADLKRYNFTYVCGFPALHSASPWLLKGSSESSSSHLTSAETTALVDAVQTWRYSVDNRQYGFFLAKRVYNSSDAQTPQDEEEDSSRDKLGFDWIVDSIGKFEQDFFNGVAEANRFICFADPSTHPQYPAWMLRNLLVLVRKRWNLKEVQILCYRDIPARRHEARSLILQIKADDASSVQATAATTADTPKISGWERNPSGKITHRITKLGEHLDPRR
jgi:ubiquitin-like modifier-activating enzyme ATG7